MNGKPGLDYAVLRAYHEFMINIKMNRTSATRDWSGARDDVLRR